MNEDSGEIQTGADGSPEGSGATGVLARLTPGVLRRRYAAKFVASLLIVVLVIATVGAAGYVETRDRVTQDTEDQLRSTATLQSDSLAEWDTHVRGQTRSLADAEALERDSPAGVRAHLQTQVDDVDSVKAVHYVDTEADVSIDPLDGPDGGRGVADLRTDDD